MRSPKRGRKLPCLGGRGDRCLPCDLFWWAVSPDPPGTQPQTQDSELRLRRQLGEVGSVLRKPEAGWAPPPPHPTPALPRPSLTQAHPRLEAGQQRQQCHQQWRLSPAKPHGQNKRPTVCPSEGRTQHPEPQRLRSLCWDGVAASGTSCCPSQAPPSPRQLVRRV